MDIDPITEILMEDLVEIMSDLTPEQMLEFSELTSDQMANMTDDQYAKYGIRSDQISKLSVDRVNFQLFLSGLGIRYTFLIHIHSGKTWQLVEDADSEELFWSLIE